MKVTFPLLLFIVFLVLKLTNVIAWSWWWVTAPLWGGLAIFLAIMTVIGIIAAIVSAFETKEQRAARKASESLRAMASRLSRR